MPNYSKTLIYKLICNDDDVDYLYVGSTTDWATRKATHKTCCTNENSIQYNKNKYVEIRANGGWNNFSMVQIEHFPCLVLNSRSKVF